MNHRTAWFTVLFFQSFLACQGIYIRPIKPPYIFSPSRSKCLLSYPGLLPLCLNFSVWESAGLPSWIKRTWFYIFCISALFKKRHDRYKGPRCKNWSLLVKLVLLASKRPWFPTKPISEWVISVLFHSSSFPRDIIFSHGHCPLNQPEQMVSCTTVYMGKGLGRNLRLWYTVTPNGEGFPGNWTLAEKKEFKKGKKVNVSLYHWNKLLTVDYGVKIIVIIYTSLSTMSFL